MYNRYFRIFTDPSNGADHPFHGLIYVKELIEDEFSVNVCGILISTDDCQFCMSHVYDMKIPKESIIQELSKSEFVHYVTNYKQHMYELAKSESYLLEDYLKDEFEVSEIHYEPHIDSILLTLPESTTNVEKIKF